MRGEPMRVEEVEDFQRCVVEVLAIQKIKAAATTHKAAVEVVPTVGSDVGGAEATMRERHTRGWADNPRTVRSGVFYSAPGGGSDQRRSSR